MLAMITEIFRVRYDANKAGNSRKFKFSILPPFLFLPLLTPLLLY